MKNIQRIHTHEFRPSATGPYETMRQLFLRRKKFAKEAKSITGLFNEQMRGSRAQATSLQRRVTSAGITAKPSFPPWFSGEKKQGGKSDSRNLFEASETLLGKTRAQNMPEEEKREHLIHASSLLLAHNATISDKQQKTGERIQAKGLLVNQVVETAKRRYPRLIKCICRGAAIATPFTVALSQILPAVGVPEAKITGGLIAAFAVCASVFSAISFFNRLKYLRNALWEASHHVECLEEMAKTTKFFFGRMSESMGNIQTAVENLVGHQGSSPSTLPPKTSAPKE